MPTSPGEFGLTQTRTLLLRSLPRFDDSMMPLRHLDAQCIINLAFLVILGTLVLFLVLGCIVD